MSNKSWRMFSVLIIYLRSRELGYPATHYLDELENTLVGDGDSSRSKAVKFKRAVSFLKQIHSKQVKPRTKPKVKRR